MSRFLTMIHILFHFQFIKIVLELIIKSSIHFNLSSKWQLRQLQMLI